MSTFLKRSREMAGLTQVQLAEKMGVSTVAVQNWESGKTNISYRRYQDLAVILNIPVDKLIKETIIDEDKSRLDNWPDFIFSEDTNKLVDMCKSQYKNVGKMEYKNVGFSTYSSAV